MERAVEMTQVRKERIETEDEKRLGKISETVQSINTRLTADEEIDELLSHGEWWNRVDNNFKELREIAKRVTANDTAWDFRRNIENYLADVLYRLNATSLSDARPAAV
ncbi:hypothetical protein CDEST_01988 [Colletotrichum destructivum]|uniref:Uncharacterized protein n=1 Tax=Colletotrichum destructivum TaxID=34406 RepID=A0AAX4I1N5_9PEZI|nr:hypothetical protein CDEST_01988 [Colletotrichum destructivum]